MKRPLLAGLASLACIAPAAHAQMVTWGPARSYDVDSSESTLRSYRLGYVQKVRRDFSLSLDYLNEGHFEGHHRDGYALEASLRVVPFGLQRVSLYGGLGAYYYFDTQRDGAGVSRDRHGLAPVVTLRAAYKFSRKWESIVTFDSVFPGNDVRVHSIGLNIGYWMDGGGGPSAMIARKASARPAGTSPASAEDLAEPRGLLEAKPSTAEPETPATDRDELSVYAAFTVINVAGNPRSDGASIEYRLRLRNSYDYHYDLSFAWLNEGDSRVSRRNGVSAQLWPVRSDAFGRMEVAVGVGAYVFIDKRRPVAPGQGPSGAVAPVVSILVGSERSAKGWFVRALWDRVVSNYDRDADVWRVGFGRTM